MTDLIKLVLWAIELLGGLAILPIIYDIDVAEHGRNPRRCPPATRPSPRQRVSRAA